MDIVWKIKTFLRANVAAKKYRFARTVRLVENRLSRNGTSNFKKAALRMSLASTFNLFVRRSKRSTPEREAVATETGLSDHHLMISTFLKAHLVRLKPKNIFYRNYKNFDLSQFLDDMKNAQFTCYTEDPNLNYENLVNTFKSIIAQGS